MLNIVKRRDNLSFIFAYIVKWRYLCNTINHTYKYNNLKLKFNMKTNEYSYKNEVITLTNDIELAKSMTEEEMQSYFNTDDSKEDFISFLEDELRVAESHIENEDDDFSFVDPGFANEADYLRYKFA